MSHIITSTDHPTPGASEASFDFGPVAGDYDRWYTTPLGRVYDRFEKRAISKVLPRPVPGGRLLDVGCGTGHWSAFFSQLGYSVTGIDIASEMISRARAKDIGNASFHVADAHRLPFDNGQFHLTTAITVLEFVRSPESVLQEMVRCTASPGGILILGVLNAMASVNIARQKAGTPPYASARFFSPKDIEALLAPHGKAQIAVTTFVPRWSSVLCLAPLAEFLGNLLHSRSGAFIVGRMLR
jgi:ubiquinone/menaquinone biosynthesis C-methylase UbiE